MTYPAEVLADNPLAYYRLGETSGTTAADSSGNAHDGTYDSGVTLNGASLLVGNSNPSLDMPGGTAIGARVAAASWMQVTTAFTAECWVRFDTLPTTESSFMSRQFVFDPDSTAKSWALGYFGGHFAAQVFVNNTTTNALVQSTGTRSTGTTYHVVATYDGTNVKIYVNGALAGTTARTGTVNPSAATPLDIGQSNHSSTYRIDGRIDEVAYYGTALSAARIGVHYAAGLGIITDAVAASTGESEAGADATVTPAVYTAVASAESDATATATITPVVVEATGEATGESDAGATASTSGAPVIDATGAASGESAASGAATIVPAGATVAVPIGDGSSDASAVVQVVAAGDTHNRVGGRNRKGIGTLTWEPPVIPTPDCIDLGDAYDTAQAFSLPTFDVPTQPVYTVSEASKRRPRDRLIIGGKDVTYFRDVATPFPGVPLIEPLLYNALTVTFPQIAACFEQVGVGALSWLKEGAVVLIQRVDRDSGIVVATDYRGIVLDTEANGAVLNVTVGGEATGRASLIQRQAPIFPFINDLGNVAYKAIAVLGIPFAPYLGPTTGISVKTFGGMNHLDYINQVVSMAQDGGAPWTIMPGSDRKYRMTRKDTTTIHGTAYCDDARTVADLHRAVSEEPNRIFLTGVTPDGQRVRFGAYPGLLQSPAAPYPFTDHTHTFGAGTTDADTDTGDGISVMLARLQVTNFLEAADAPGGYDADVTSAIRALQRKAGLTLTTHMNIDTWNALYDLSATGFSLNWSTILPAAELDSVREWNRSGSGAIMSRNDSYDSTVLPIDRNVDVGTGFTKQQMRRWAEAELTDGATPNWTGSITFNTGALILGDHTPGDPVTDMDFMPARDLLPGMNLSLPLFGGGIVVHIAAASTGPDGTVSVDVDTRARDAMKVWEIIDRNRETRANMTRAWIRSHRSSTQTPDSIGIWDEVGGLLGDKVTVPGGRWVVFPVVAGEEGTVRSIRTRTNPNAEYVLAVFGKKIAPGRLRSLVGNPLTKAGAKRWAKQSVRTSLDVSNILLYVAGDNDQPCGYFPKVKTGTDDNDTAPAPLTGDWQDDAGFSYHTFRVDGKANPGVIYVAIFADRDTHVPPGRIMWDQLDGSGV